MQTLDQLTPGQKFPHPTTGEVYQLVKLSEGCAVVRAKGKRLTTMSLSTEVKR